MSKRTADSVNIAAKKARETPELRGPAIQLEIEVAAELINTVKPWQYGTVRTWKSLASHSGAKTFKINYTVTMQHQIPIADCDVTILHEVLKILKYDSEAENWSTPAGQQWSKIEQRLLQRAFTDGFTNSSGRNFVDCLLRMYLHDGKADPTNVGGSALPNNQMRKMELIYTYYGRSSDHSGHSSSSSEENRKSTRVPEFRNSESSSEYDVLYHTPVVDNMMYDESKNRAIIIISVKKSRFTKTDYEQLRHEMLSMLPLDDSVTGRVGGILICQFGAVFMVASKSLNMITMTLLQDFDFEDDICQQFPFFIGYMINFYNYCKGMTD